MRHKGAISEVKISRDRDLVRMYREVIAASKEPLTTQRICEEVANRPVKRFYLSEERGYYIYLHWSKHLEFPRAGKYALRMYIHYIQECEKLVKSGLLPMDATRRAIDHPACCVGLSPYRIYRIVTRERKKRKS